MWETYYGHVVICINVYWDSLMNNLSFKKKKKTSQQWNHERVNWSIDQIVLFYHLWSLTISNSTTLKFHKKWELVVRVSTYLPHMVTCSYLLSLNKYCHTSPLFFFFITFEYPAFNRPKIKIILKFIKYVLSKLSVFLVTFVDDEIEY